MTTGGEQGAVGVTVHATEDLTPATRRAVIDVCNAANDTTEFEALFDVYIPSGGRHVLGHLDGRIVGHAVATTRHVQPEGHPILRTAFLDAVATHPDVQHRGVATAVVGRLGEVLDDYEVGCLQTDIPAFYERIGWEPWRGALAGRRDDGTLVPTPEQRGVMVLRLPTTPPLDLDGRLTIECQPNRVWGA
jgi:aminoglycoside 2'-N-acetyltransferase I